MDNTSSFCLKMILSTQESSTSLELQEPSPSGLISSYCTIVLCSTVVVCYCSYTLLKLSYYWGGPITDVVLYITEMVQLLRWSYYWGGPITEVVLLLRWSYYWGGPITEVVPLPRRSYYWGGPITEVVLFLRWSYYWGGPIYYWGGPITEVVTLLRWFYYWGGSITEGVFILRWMVWLSFTASWVAMSTQCIQGHICKCAIPYICTL